jgi:hypothetical protein
LTVKRGRSRYSPRFLNLQGNKKENKEILNQINNKTIYKLERLASDKQNYSFNRQMNRQQTWQMDRETNRQRNKQTETDNKM